MTSRVSALVMLVAALSGQISTPGAQPDARLVNACVQSQQQASALAAQLSRRLESVRGTNSATDIRAAMDDLQAALHQMRTALQSCAVAPNPSAPGVAAPTPAVPVDHAAMGHTAPTTQPAELDQQLVTVCVQGQQAAAGFAERLNRRLEMARQTNGAAEMRAGMADLPAALSEVRTSLQKCEPLRAAVAAAEAAAVAATMDHSKMAMGGAPAAEVAAKPAAPTAPMDHSKMPMGSGAATGKPGTAAGAKPAAGPKPGAPTPPMDHTKMPMGATAPAPGADHAAMKMDAPKLPVMPAPRIADPACPSNVTQANAPKAVHERRVYYFCSAADRDLFRKDPAAYLKKRPR